MVGHLVSPPPTPVVPPSGSCIKTMPIRRPILRETIRGGEGERMGVCA